MTRPLVYVAHPLNAPTPEAMAANRLNGARWCGWLARHCGVAPQAPWIVLSSVWTEEEGRELGLEIDKATIAVCRALILTGGRISSGMQVEIQFARSVGVRVCDLTGHGTVAPDYRYTANGHEWRRRSIQDAVRAALAEAA
jgi:hypothetical protein